MPLYLYLEMSPDNHIFVSAQRTNPAIFICTKLLPHPPRFTHSKEHVVDRFVNQLVIDRVVGLKQILLRAKKDNLTNDQVKVAIVDKLRKVANQLYEEDAFYRYLVHETP